MNLLFDGRALQSTINSGVPRVARWLLETLASDTSHTITVFTSGIEQPSLFLPSQVRHVHLRIPNKLLHLSLFLFRWPKLDLLVSRYTGETYDAVFLPNLHFFVAKAPFALLVHDLSFLVHPQFFSLFERFVHTLKRPLRKLRDARWLFAVSRSTASDIERFVRRRDATIIDISGAASICAWGQSPAALVTVPEARSFPRRDFVFLSTTEPRKNLESAILGFLASQESKKARKQNTDRLLIIGAITREGKKLQQKYFGARNVIWLGNVDDDTRTTLLARAKALLYPSQFEGFGLPLLEAGRLGTPIITSQRTSMPEVAPHAILIDPERPESIALGIMAVSADTQESNTARKHGTTTAEMAKIVYTILAK